MKMFKFILTTLFATMFFYGFSQKNIEVQHFDKVVISPFIRVTLVEGNQETVTIEEASVEHKKIIVEITGTTLRIYLEGAKEIPNVDLKAVSKGDKENYPNYYGTVVTATITYKNLAEVSVRGEEPLHFKSPLVGDDFRLKVYGTSVVVMNEADLKECHVSLYGEGTFEVRNGRIGYQHYTVYGTGKVNTMAIEGTKSKITSYGSSDFQVNVSEQIKFNAFGDASLRNKGNAIIVKGLQFGDMNISKAD